MPSTAPDYCQHIALAAVLNMEGEILLLERPMGASHGGLWSFPGGKVERGETPLAAACRELTEETGIAGVGWRLLGEGEYAYPNRRLYFHLFLCYCHDPAELICPEPYLWVAPERLKDYRMPQANIDLLNPMLIAHVGATER